MMPRTVVSFSIAFLLLIGVILLSRITYNNTQKSAAMAEHSRNIINLYDEINVEVRSAEIFSPSYENSGAKDLYALYKSDMDSVQPHLKRLQKLVAENAQQAEIVDRLEKAIVPHLPVLRTKNLVEIIQSGEMYRFDDLTKAHRLVLQGLSLEEKILDAQKKSFDKQNGLNNLLTILLSALALFIILATFFSQTYLSRKSRWLEGFLESVLNTSQNGILHCRAIRKKNTIIDFKLVYANKASCNLLGTDPKTLTGKRWSEIAAFKDTSLFAACANVIDTRQSTELEHVQHSEAAEKSFVLAITKLKDGVTISFYENTDLKKTAQELISNITALKQTNRELEEYAYAASHDLQEPLRKIKTFGVFLKEAHYESLDQRGRQHLDKIVQAAERMTMLIKDLLSFSGLKTRGVEFERTDLNEILETVLQDLELTITQTGAVITHEKLPEIDIIPVQMNQLFYNLVSNSLKFAKADLPLHLDVSCKLVRGKDVNDVPGLTDDIFYYEIIFSDNGIGFNQHYAKRIFELFKRLHDKARYEGSGIGLSLCKKVVTNHNGVITANGKEGIGAQFYIYLPQTQSFKSSSLQEPA